MVNSLKIDEAAAFFGGSFDPPHLGHLTVAEAALNGGFCRQVVWVPAYAPPHKQRQSVSFDDRAAMTALTIGGRANMSVSRIEADLALSPSYTITILEAWRDRYGAAPALLIGADSLLELHTWHRAGELVENYKVITYPRRSCPITAEALTPHWRDGIVRKLLSGVIPGDFFEISSSELKSAMEKFNGTGDIINVKQFLVPAVAEYIVVHGLYIGSR